jgi:hypothetical protein
MSCWHGWHGCGPWHAGPYGEPYGPGWYPPEEWYEGPEWPVRRRARSGRTAARERSGEALEARLDELRREIQELELELASTRGEAEPDAERP